jgi:nucleoside-diphosphate kinase
VAERSLVLIKPDAVRRGLVGEIISRFERKGLTLDALMLLDAAIVSGDEAIAVIRLLVGATDGRAAAAGTIRGDFSLSNRENLVHASDSTESAEREIKLWFPELS